MVLLNTARLGQLFMYAWMYAQCSLCRIHGIRRCLRFIDAHDFFAGWDQCNDLRAIAVVVVTAVVLDCKGVVEAEMNRRAVAPTLFLTLLHGVL